MNEFKAFDPLVAKYAQTEVASLAIKRELQNILDSYVGWYDPFSELIQNSLDSLETRTAIEGKDYEPTLWIKINIKDNMLIVTDNGTGLNEQEFKQFLAPNVSFKSGNTRGHKGVGATYLAYGFNYIQISTRTDDYAAVGKMTKARKWLNDENPSGNPEVQFDKSGSSDDDFDKADKGVSVCLKFDKTTYPKTLAWTGADDANAWLRILSVKTGLGAVAPNKKLLTNITIISKNSKVTNATQQGIEYLKIHHIVKKSESYKGIALKTEELFKKRGPNFTLPSRYKNLDAFYETWDTNEVKSLLAFTNEELEICNRFEPSVYFAYVYSLKVWDAFNQTLSVRSNLKILYGGIQVAANNMPQGEIIQIPLRRNIGRQNQVHFLIHFNNCSADLGRKGFQKEIVDFSKEIASRLVDGPLKKFKHVLRPTTGASPDLMREKEVEDWKDEMSEYEKTNPLQLINQHFFLPLNRVSITSIPTREQDVIALFNQLVAGGVIRGIRIMSTNERLTYDSLYRIILEEPIENHVHDNGSNPLGVQRDIIDEFKEIPFVSKPRVLEYKFSLDGLIENIEDGSKNSNDIGLVVVWETGEDYQGNYQITSLLDENNLSLRQYHGLTHLMTNVNTGQKEIDLIVLKELIEFLNDPIKSQKEQTLKYEEF